MKFKVSLTPYVDPSEPDVIGTPPDFDESLPNELNVEVTMNADGEYVDESRFVFNSPIATVANGYSVTMTFSGLD